MWVGGAPGIGDLCRVRQFGYVDALESKERKTEEWIPHICLGS
jgi:hypothetical protein